MTRIERKKRVIMDIQTLMQETGNAPKDLYMRCQKSVEEITCEHQVNEIFLMYLEAGKFMAVKDLVDIGG